MKLKYILPLLAILSFNSAAAGISTKAKYALLVDADTNQVLYEKNSKTRMAPSSMSKLMTVYIAFQRLKEGSLKLNDKVVVSKNAWSKGGSRMFLPLNEEVSVEDLLKGIIIQSGNDASTALAESIAGSEEAFVARMNTVAQQIGLTNSHFTNSTGWPDKNHYMTAEDLAKLTNAIVVNFPEHYHYFSEKEFTYNRIKQTNRNVLINRNIGVDGLKTGHTDSGGYGIAASAKQGNRRLVLVLNGTSTDSDRAIEAQKLLQYGFLNFTNVKVAMANDDIASAEVYLGNANNVNLVCPQNLIFTVPVEHKNQIHAVASYEEKLKAPIAKNQKVGVIEIRIPNQEPKTFDMCTKHDILEAGLMRKTYHKVKYWVQNLTFSSPKLDEARTSKELMIN